MSEYSEGFCDVLGDMFMECVSHGNNGQDVYKRQIIGRGAPHGKGGTSLPTSAAVGRVIGENGKKLAFLLVLL